MSIILKTVVVDGIGTESKIVVITSAESFAQFSDLISAGATSKPNMPANVKQFVDMVITGRVLQDYYAQENSKAESAYEEAIFKITPN